MSCVLFNEVAAETTAIFAVIPREAETWRQLRAVHVVPSERIALDENNYWLLQTGTITGSTFKVLLEKSLAQGLAAGAHREIPCTEPVHFRRGDRCSFRLTPRGLPSPIAGLSVAVEWSTLSNKSAGRPPVATLGGA